MNPTLIGNALALSFQSVAEIWKLAFGRRWGRRRCDELDAFLRRFLIIPYDYELARIWARLSVEAERAGHRLESAMRGSRRPPCAGVLRFLRMIAI